MMMNDVLKGSGTRMKGAMRMRGVMMMSAGSLRTRESLMMCES